MAFVFGASLLLDTDSPQFQLSWSVIGATAALSAGVLALILGFALRAQRRAVTTGEAELVAQPATVLEWEGDHGYVQVRGERWAARGDESFAPGTRVRVTDVHGLALRVCAMNEPTGDEP